MRKLISLYAQEYFHGAERMLLDVSGALPTTDAPERTEETKTKSPAQVAGAVSGFLFGVDLRGSHQVGSVASEGMEIYVIRGDVLYPGSISESPVHAGRLWWAPVTDIETARKSLQTFIIALCRSRVRGWHIEDTEDGVFHLSYRMRTGAEDVQFYDGKTSPEQVP